MEDVQLSYDEKGYGKFSISEGIEQIAEMVISIAGNNLMVYHTEVSPKGEGKGNSQCPFYHAQFKRHPEGYADVWNRNEQ